MPRELDAKGASPRPDSEHLSKDFPGFKNSRSRDKRPSNLLLAAASNENKLRGDVN